MLAAIDNIPLQVPESESIYENLRTTPTPSNGLSPNLTRADDVRSSPHNTPSSSRNHESSSRPVQIGSPNSAFVTPAKRAGGGGAGSLRRSATVNAALSNERKHPGTKTVGADGFKPRDSPDSLSFEPRSQRDVDRESISSKDSPHFDNNSPLGHSSHGTVTMRQPSDSPRSRSPSQDPRRHSALGRLHSPVNGDTFGVDSYGHSTPRVDHQQQTQGLKISPSRRRTIGSGPLDKPPPYNIAITRRQYSDVESDTNASPPPVPPLPFDYDVVEPTSQPPAELNRLVPTKARSRSPILSLEDDPSKKLEEFVNTFNRNERKTKASSTSECQGGDEGSRLSDAQQFRQRSYSEASTVPDHLSTLERRRSAKLVRSPAPTDSVFTFDGAQSPPASFVTSPTSPDAPIKPMYKASLNHGPLPRGRSLTESSPGKGDYRSALRRVSMKNSTMFNQIRS